MSELLFDMPVKRRAIGGHHNPVSQSDEWLTPPGIIEALGGAASFDLDPCTPAVQPWPTARARYTKAENGLLLPWFGRVWLNPPYSRPAYEQFMDRMAAHGRGAALIFARTETQAFFRCVWERAAALLFLRGRINFHRPDGRMAKGNAGAPVVLIAYGQADAEILAFARIEGQFVPLRLPRGVLVQGLSASWREALGDWFARQSGPVALADIYRAFARHPKAAGNPNFAAKIRQVLQQGPYRRVGRGVWALEGEAA